MKKSFKNSAYVLYILIFSWNQLLFASNKSHTDPFNKTGPAATKAQVDADFQKTFAGLFATASNLPPIMEPTQERIAKLPKIYANPNDYYKRYGLTYDQARQLYLVSGSDQKSFRSVYGTITQSAKTANVSIDVALQAYLSGQPIVPMPQAQQQIVQQGPAQPQIPQPKPMPQPVVIPVQVPVQQQMPIPQPRPVQQQKPVLQQIPVGQVAQGIPQLPLIEPPLDQRFGDSYYKTYGLTAEQAGRMYKLSGDDLTRFQKNYAVVQSSAAKNNQTISDAFETIAARVKAAKNQLPPIQPPINERFNDAYYKAYEITAEQARRLYEKTGQSFREYYDLGKRIAARDKVAVFEAIARASFDLAKLRLAAAAAQNPLPGRPARNFWTKSAFGYIPAGKGETIESRADKLVYGAGRFIADTAAKPLEKVTLWTQPEYLDKGGYYVSNPESGKKFTLLDAVDAVFANSLVRGALELTIIGPLDTNKELKMRQFIMILLVTHYNSYKLILSPMGALNFAVNRILFPIKAVSSVSKVSMFLMRQALTVFNQYNLNGGNLEQALSNQAANLVLGQIGTVASGTKRAVTGTAGLIGRGFGTVKRGLGVVKRGFGTIFKAK